VKVGVISDTHDYLDPRVMELFDGVEHILHAGDVGSAWITFQLEQIAPVTAVIGNTDSQLSLNENEVVTLAKHKFMVQHIVNPQTPDEKLRRLIAKHQPSVVVFGHTHKTFDQALGKTRFFNPGYSGKPKFNQPRSIAIIHCDDVGITPEFISLS
jgi:putative phosphoesterase